MRIIFCCVFWVEYRRMRAGGGEVGARDVADVLFDGQPFSRHDTVSPKAVQVEGEVSSASLDGRKLSIAARTPHGDRMGQIDNAKRDSCAGAA